ncbi:ATP-dependent nuclease [Pseudomonas viridiflava]|uniref:ATP-dependent nuclease n=3 Tax=Pseudomonas viridiflava TaxID=33069 RepID=UPI0013CE7773|nr:AAA family ATPase [Pseudomonas viridiflava]
MSNPAKKPKAHLTNLTFSSDQVVTLDQNDRIIIVGANNSGKSQLLRDIVEVSGSVNATHAKVVNKVEVSKEGSQQSLLDFLRENGEPTDPNHYRYGIWNIYEGSLYTWDSPGLHQVLQPAFIKNITANERLNICQDQASISPGQPKTRPQHFLYDSDSLTDKISGLFKASFGKDLMFDFRGGSILPLHVGEKPSGDIMVDRVGDAYTQAVRKNPLLSNQGDGMKGYAGILFEAIVSPVDITLIDEPEAFLHPPQMRKLGETLASQAKGQLIVSTHSSDILRGFLEGTKGQLRVIRLRREGDKNYVHEADTETIESLWQKPDLRYSNALEGLFHEETIICEDDSDCRLINSIADHCAKTSISPWKDTAYIPTGGKHAIPLIAKVLRKAGVPLKAIFDIDFLSEKELVQNTISAFGGEWSEYEKSWNIINAGVRSGIPEKKPNQIIGELMEILSSVQDEKVPKTKIIDAMKQSSPWNTVKRHGSRVIPRGEATAEFNSLKNKLEGIGIYIIDVGEIENFCPEVGSHGPKYVTSLLKGIPLDDGRLAGLREFVSHVHMGTASKV